MFKVELGVKGAQRITVHLFHDRFTAIKTASRWSKSNSLGSYWAEVTKGGREIASFNLK